MNLSPYRPIALLTITISFVNDICLCWQFFIFLTFNYTIGEMIMKKYGFVSIICAVLLLSGLNFSDYKPSVNTADCIKNQSNFIHHKICDNGFNPNKKKKC